MTVRRPRLVIAGLSGDSGKTIVSLSLLAVLRQKALSVSVFKKGPDYIDAAWLTRVAGQACRNLDTYMVKAERVYISFVQHSSHCDLALIEGNRGLFDGKDLVGTHSTAELAKLLKAPVVLVVNCTKTTRTIAALVKGCIEFDPDVHFVGVVLNRIGGKRHETTIRGAIEKYCKLPVLGVIPRLESESFLIPGRHLGLVPPAEFTQNPDFDSGLADIGSKYLDIDQMMKAASAAPDMETVKYTPRPPSTDEVRIGYFRDPVFTFYYPENLEALENAGAKLVPVSSLADSSLPDVDGFYIGGGFPESFSDRLSRNKSMLTAVRSASESGMPIYAECGGLIYLSRSLTQDDKRCPMADVFPIDLTLQTKPAGHGYTLLTVDGENPFFEVGTEIRGHEFHYSKPTAEADQVPLDDNAGCLTVRTGVGLGNGRDGLLYKSTMAAYTHIHADGVSGWAASMVLAARRFSQRSDKVQPDDTRGGVEGRVDKGGRGDNVFFLESNLVARGVAFS